MLFVFQVDTGRMMTFDMSLALESVENLKTHIERVCKIPVDKQVLLISGGENVDPEARVCSYPAGTDTNPIYLFSKLTKYDQPAPSTLYGTDLILKTDFAAKVKESSEWPPSYTTVQRRTQLAQTFSENGKELIKLCESLVHEQHLQHQAWASVVANLEDLENELTHRWAIFKELFFQYSSNRTIYLQLVKQFKNDLQLLQKIPVLAALMDSQKMYVPDLEELNDEKQMENLKGDTTLFDWISQNDDFMDTLFDICSKGLLQTDEEFFRALEQEVERVMNLPKDLNMREIKGLGERLCSLEKLMLEAKTIIQDQVELAKSFLRNQSRASQVKEASVLPDLCATHLQQLEVLLKNHVRLRDITRRCILAKDELSANLAYRLQWIVFVEGNLSELDNKLVFHFELLLSLQRQLEILEQVHTAPAVYLSAVAEVVRRRKFSQAFLLWASDVACHLLTIHNEELTRRKEFQSTFEGHFLSALFPGMEDMPPSFATQAPSIFDSSLPKLSEDDVEKLRKELPELAENLSIPSITAALNFLMLKDPKDDVDKRKAVEEKLIEVVTEAGVASNLDQNLLKAIENAEQATATATTSHGLPHLKDLDRGCESETDTEEFEKVGQSPFDLHFDKGIPSPRPGTQDASTITEKPHIQTQDDINALSSSLQRTLSISGSQSNTESFTNLKNPSLESIDELSSLKNFSSNTESCFNSHHQQMQGYNSALLLRSKSISPHTPQSPKDIQVESPNSPVMGHQHNDFVNDEFYIDESLPSSLSIETGQSQGEFVKQLDTANNVVALLQDNLQISRSEYEKLKSLLFKLSDLAKQVNSHLKEELNEIKDHLLKEKILVEESCGNLSFSIENAITQRESRERETIQQLTVDHELEISDLRKVAQGKNDEIKSLKDENLELEAKTQRLGDEIKDLKKRLEDSHIDSDKHIEELKRKIDDLFLEKEKSIKEVTDRLKCEHRGEIENIRARFKLMTMERSPSENSLEKIDKGEFSSITNPEALLLQMTENFQSEKEVAVSDAVNKETIKWQQILDDTVKTLEQKFEKEKEIIINDMIEKSSKSKDKEITNMMEQIKNLSLECVKHKNTIQQLTEYSVADDSKELLEKIEALEKDKLSLELELQRSKSDYVTSAFSASVAVCESTGVGTSEAATSPIKFRKRFDPAVKCGKLSIDSCKAGELVMVVWDPEFKNFRVHQESPYMFLLNAESLETLGLKVENGQPNRHYCIAEVVEKEYCLARKSVNRFKVPKGTKFFRVKAKPLPVQKEPKPTFLPRDMSQSQTTSNAMAMEVFQSFEATHSLPSSPSRVEVTSWDRSEMSQSPIIPEETGEESTSGQEPGEVEKSDADIEKGTELTENFNVESHTSIDRSQICVIA